MRNIILMGLLVFCLFACAPFQNLNMQDVRVAKNKIGDGTISYTLVDINNFIEKYNYNCNGTAKLVFDGDNKQLASYITYGMGFNQMNPYLIVDFKDNHDGTTEYNGYAVYAHYKYSLDELLGIIDRKGACKK